MADQLTAALIERLNPFLYAIGLLVVFGFVSFGGSIISLWWKTKNKQEDKLEKTLESLRQALAENTLSIGRVEAKLELLSHRYDKDLNNLGAKIRRLEA